MKRTRKRASRQQRIADMDKEILDVEGAAIMLGVSRTTIYKLAQQGKIPAARVGKEWRFARRNLIDWVSTGGSNDKVSQLASLLKTSKVRLKK